MAVREDLVASAVTFLQDPNVSASSLENRIAFLQSKNLTQEEIDVAIARANGGGGPGLNYSNYGQQQQQQQMVRQAPGDYGGYQQYQWQQPPPEIPRRDWRDWFIMATVVGGVSYGLYTVAKRYVVPLIAPPTPPQLEQDKATIDASFTKAFNLLDQLSADTSALKAAEAARTARLDTALTEVESVIAELKTSSRRREDDTQRIGDEVRGLKDLIPKALEGQKEVTDNRLRELNAELKSLKMLMGQRMNPPSGPAAATTTSSSGSNLPFNRLSSSTPIPTPSATSTSDATTAPTIPKPASVSSPSGTSTEAIASLQNRTASPFSAGIPSGRAAIPVWQMAAAANKNASGGVEAASGSAAAGQEGASGSA